MVGFIECLNRAVAGGEMDAELAEGAKTAFDNYVKDMSPEEAQAKVVAEAAEIARQSRKRVEANAKAQSLIKRKIDAGLTPAKIVEDFEHKGSLRFRHETIRAQLRGEMNAVLKTFRSNIVGQRRNKATLENMVRERYGQSTGDGAASELSQSFGAAQSLAKELYENAGGFVRTKANFGVPQSHSQVRVGKVPAEQWADEVMQLIDVKRLTDDLGGDMTEEGARDALIDMHEHIASGGWAARERFRARKLGERKTDPDFLPFKNGDAWLSYAEMYGEQTDPWRAMVGYIDNMAHQIAEVEVLGIDADASWQFATDYFLEKNRGSDIARERVRFANAMRDTWSGVVQEPENRMFARGMSNVRQYLASVQLGSAFISSLSDVATSRAASAFVGLSRNGHLKNVQRLISSKDFRENAREMGLILENAVDMGAASHRYSMEDFTTDTAARLSDFTMRSSLLSGWTQVSRDAVGMSALGDLAKMRNLAFDELEERVKGTFEGFGITPEMWDGIRASEVHTVQGVEFLRPKEIEAAAGRDAALSVMEFVNALQSRSILTSSIRVQAATRGTQSPGSLSGEALRTIAQYKTFPIEFMLRPLAQIYSELANKNYAGAIDQASIIFIGTTLLGAVSYQAKEITKGRNPKDMDTVDFWTAAALQGGGLGIFGDFLFADHNRYGRSAADTFLGPTANLLSDSLKVTVGNAQQVVRGEETNFGREAVKFAIDYTPAQSLWYARLAFERLAEDNLMRLVDPDAQARFNRKIVKSEREGQGYWFRPGEIRPE